MNIRKACFSMAILIVPVGLAGAGLRSDNFNDNSQAATWKKFEENPDSCWVNEINQRLEITANGDASDRGALYVPNNWGFVTTADFQVKVDFYNSIVSSNWNEVYIGIGYGYHLDNFNDDYIYLAAGCDDNYPVFWSEYVEDQNTVAGYWKTRSSNSGTLYISYDASEDKLYLSDSGYGSASAWKIFSGVLQGAWGNRIVGVGIGGSSVHVAMSTGQAYVDNFVIDSGTLCTNRPEMDFNDDCKVDFEDFAVFCQSWLDCNLNP